MFNNKEDLQTEKDSFLQKMESTVNDQINNLVLAELRSGRTTFKTLNLEPKNGQSSIWGLICIGNNGIYFYTAPQQGYLEMFMSRREPNRENKEQVINLSDFNIQYKLPKKTKLDFLLPEKRRTIKASFIKNNESHNIDIILSVKAETIIQELHK